MKDKKNPEDLLGKNGELKLTRRDEAISAQPALEGGFGIMDELAASLAKEEVTRKIAVNPIPSSPESRRLSKFS